MKFHSCDSQGRRHSLPEAALDATQASSKTVRFHRQNTGRKPEHSMVRYQKIWHIYTHMTMTKKLLSELFILSWISVKTGYPKWDGILWIGSVEASVSNLHDQSLQLRRTRYHLPGHLGPQNGALSLCTSKHLVSHFFSSETTRGQVMPTTCPFLRLLWNPTTCTPCTPSRHRRWLGCRAVELEHLRAEASSESPLHQSRCQKGLPMSDEGFLLRFRGRQSDFRCGGFCKLRPSQSTNLLYSNETLGYLRHRCM